MSGYTDKNGTFHDAKNRLPSNPGMGLIDQGRSNVAERSES